MPPALKALFAQTAAWAGVWLLARGGLLPPGLFALVTAQALLAVVLATALRSAPWWLLIHLLFTPLLVLAHRLDLHPAWYLAAFIMLCLTYWSTFRTQVPLYLSGHASIDAVRQRLPETPGARVLDIGSGTGRMLIALARARPDLQFTGIESAPAPRLLARLLSRMLDNIEWRAGDFFEQPWSEHDLVYAFLSPVPMPAVWAKACREMRPGAVLISNSFPVPSVQADETVSLPDRRGSRLFIYHPGRRVRAGNGSN
ncbi:MAG: class I SAM-dependent methyltransferase [Rhodocyclaceae bacterium]|jgi:SAM-dependent methyltransferase|nr:class I SAM-dependent methyltransferase [Rhodocyclaceae bacterium]